MAKSSTIENDSDYKPPPPLHQIPDNSSESFQLQSHPGLKLGLVRRQPGEAFSDEIAIEFQGERYSTHLNEWVQICSHGYNAALQFLMQKKVSTRFPPSSYQSPIGAAGGFASLSSRSIASSSFSSESTGWESSAFVPAEPNVMSSMMASRRSSIAVPSDESSPQSQTPRASTFNLPSKRKMSPDDDTAGSSTEEIVQDYEEEPEDAIMIHVTNRKHMEEFFLKTFLLLQQATMKLMLKSWIKHIEPEKQKKWPYCLSSDRRPKPSAKPPKQSPDGQLQPPWWPKGVNHIEPDHLGREGCHKLALAIIRKVQSRPDRQGIQALRTETDRLNLRFDKESDQKYERRVEHLQQLFKVAIDQQDYLLGCRAEADFEPIAIMNLRPAPKPRAQRIKRKSSKANKQKRTKRTREQSALGSPISHHDTAGDTPRISAIPEHLQPTHYHVGQMDWENTYAPEASPVAQQGLDSMAQFGPAYFTDSSLMPEDPPAPLMTATFLRSFAEPQKGSSPGLQTYVDLSAMELQQIPHQIPHHIPQQIPQQIPQREWFSPYSFPHRRIHPQC